MRIVSLVVLCLALAVVPAIAQQILYDNGPANGTVDAWTINFGYVVSDSFKLSANGLVSGFDFYVWAYPGDTALTVDWSITSAEFGGTTYGSGTASLSSSFISSNQYGYDIDKLSVSGLYVKLGNFGGTYWLNLANATTSFGDPLFWDENSGPSSASESAVGTIASEAFRISGTSVPEPSIVLMYGSSALCLVGLLRRKRL